jgi:EAL domain-containing protein (putative c-di-GMP-specific phosphodiesterase class I)
MTESVMMESTADTINLLRQLKQLGIRLAVDDFGTGYSSLSYLARFPVDLLKIDRSFVEKIAADSYSAELVRTIVRLGQSLGLQTVAEGIENTQQLEALREIGCAFGQGFMFSKPVPAARIAAFLNNGLPVMRNPMMAPLALAAAATRGGSRDA